jgi:hypothetical protein
MNIKKSDMGNKINVAEILKDKPKGTKLYSDICCGECVLNEVSENAIYVDMYNKERFWFFSVYGTIYAFPNGGVLLYPSYEMRDWRKFAWKKGDVLVNKDNNSHIIFEKFNDDTYTTFTGKLYYQATKAGYSYAHTRNIAMTQDFDIEEGDAAQTYINTIEEKLGGKLNRETLEVEKTQPEFKDGDIVAVDLYRKNIRIFKEKKNGNNICWGKYYIGFSFNNEGKLIQTFKNYTADCSSDRLATEEEKQQLFDALAKEGKAWDAEKKEVVGLKPKVEFKPFDKVLVRDNEDDIWEVSLFGYKDELYYRCDNGIPWIQCIPYDGNEHLLGTTNNVEG